MRSILGHILALAALASAVCIPLLWRIIRIQKATIQALSIHVQALSAYIETVTRRLRGKKVEGGQEGEQKDPSGKSGGSEGAKIQPLSRPNIERPRHKKAS